MHYMICLVAMNYMLLETVGKVTRTNTTMPTMMRTKRVIYGQPTVETDRDYYDIFRYYVFLGFEEPPWWKYLIFDVTPDPDYLKCGGSLLTPFIIQTAGHCVGDPIVIPGQEYASYRAKNVWEEPLFAYVGSNLATSMSSWLRPKEYVTLEANANYVYQGNPYIMPTRTDIGLVLAKDSIVDVGPWAEISYAPAYPRKDIEDFYEEAIRKEYMCLTIGHGNSIVLLEPEEQVLDAIVDPVLWGWRTIMNPVDCESLVYDYEKKLVLNLNYLSICTWVCTQSPVGHASRAQNYLYLAGTGDSGSPIACNNVYFSIVSTGTDPTGTDLITTSTPIKQDLYANSAEWRADFLAFYKEIVWPDRAHSRSTPTHHSSFIGHQLLSNSPVFFSLTFILYFAHLIYEDL